jgi:hypothetical protein
MSYNEDNGEVREIPSFEPWMGIVGLAFVPALATVFAPAHLDMPLIGVAAVVLVVAGGALGMQTARRKREQKTGAVP